MQISNTGSRRRNNGPAKKGAKTDQPCPELSIVSFLTVQQNTLRCWVFEVSYALEMLETLAETIRKPREYARVASRSTSQRGSLTPRGCFSVRPNRLDHELVFVDTVDLARHVVGHIGPGEQGFGGADKHATYRDPATESPRTMVLRP